MRTIILVAAVIAALGMASQPAEARDRGFGFRQFSEHAVPKLHLRHQGFKFHHGGFVGEPRSFKSRHFGQRGLVLKFSDGDVVLRFGNVPFMHRQFSHRHRHRGLFFEFEESPRFRSWHDPGFGFEDRRELRVRPQSMPGSHGGGGGGLQGGAPPEALLKQLEEMGFRHVPELLRSGHR